MAKIDLQDIASLTNEQSAIAAINNNSAEIEDISDSFLSRDGTTPNTMEADIDMDSNRILNLPVPVSDDEPATKAYVELSVTSGSTDIASSVLAAAASATAAASSATSAATSASTATAELAKRTGTSTTSLTPTVASKAFTIVESSRDWTAGQFLLAKSDSNSAVWMWGPVTSYSANSLVLDSQAIGTASAKADWTITVSGARGATGAAGADYTADTELLALSTLTNTTGILTQTAADTFTTRNIVSLSGTTAHIAVTNPAGVLGDYTLDTGTKVVTTDADYVMESGKTLTYTPTICTAHNPIQNGDTLVFTDGNVQYAITSAGGTFNLVAPQTGYGQMLLLLKNGGVMTALNPTLSAGAGNTACTQITGTRNLATNGHNLIYIWRTYNGANSYVHYQVIAGA